ncbi:ABC transporter permease [Mycoplasma sp. SG1]|uniref:ABC transporter permease n=1 Tax=Mycoplasma sp. SG1 TaxID=2810348 RepID=UPI00202509DA|nr:ABC transporter permease [Mycoplasma sp. SG1]URM52978.1 ABC transporter permease [Mycoplasma sp. SG1]
MWYIFKNTWKAIWSNKVHFFSLFLLIIASLSVSWGVLSANSGLNQSFDKFKTQSNPSQFSIDLNSSVTFFKSPPNNIDNVEHFTKQLTSDLKKENLKIDLSYRDERLFPYHESLLLAIGYAPGYHFSWGDNNAVDTIIHTSENQDFSNLKKDQILTEGNFSSANNWDINNQLTNLFGEKSIYKVVGHATSFDFSYPLLSPINMVASTSSNGIIFVSPEALYNVNPSEARLNVSSSADRQQLLLVRFHDPSNYTETNLNKVKDVLKDIYSNSEEFIAPSDTKYYGIRSDYYNNAFFQERINSYHSFMKFEVIATHFLSYLIIIVTCFVVAAVTRKRIEADQDNILIFKALGYKKSWVNFIYSIYPLIFSLFCFLIALFISYGFQSLIYKIFISMFTIPLITISFSYISFIVNIALITIIFILVAFVSTSLTLRKIRKGV